jgi:hypothetical protein
MMNAAFVVEGYVGPRDPLIPCSLLHCAANPHLVQVAQEIGGILIDPVGARHFERFPPRDNMLINAVHKRANVSKAAMASVPVGDRFDCHGLRRH